MNAVAQIPAESRIALPGDGAPIDLWEQEVVTRDLPQIEIPIEHHFDHGVYARKMTSPAMTIISGRVHRHGHLCMVLRGHIRVFDGVHGGVVRDLRGGDVFSSQPNARRMLYSVEETVFITVHRTDKTTADEVEEEIFMPSWAKETMDRRKLQKKEALCLV